MVQLSHPCITTGKIIPFTIGTFVGKVMSLLFNMLSRFVIAFLPRSKHLLISWLQSPSGLILEPKKIKYVTVSIVSPSICHEVMGLDAMILVLWMLSFKPAFFTLLFHFHQEALFRAILVSRICLFTQLAAGMSLLPESWSPTRPAVPIGSTCPWQSPYSPEACLPTHFSALRVMSSAYLRLLIFLPAVLIPAWWFHISAEYDVLCI